MRAAGRLGDRSSQLPGGDFAVGDLVVVKRNDLRLGVVNGDRGRVTAVDPDARQLTLDLGGRAGHARPPASSTTAPPHGDPTLQHGYAITGHVAQGLTVDHAFVLAGAGPRPRVGYTALSRGRETNHLYVAADPDTARVEYAPTDPHKHDPIARLTAQLQTSCGGHARDRHRAGVASESRARRRRA